MLSYVWVSLGGAIGTAARFWLSGAIAERFGYTFPLGTLLVNVSGSFVIGALAAMADPAGRWSVAPSAREFLMIGVCGGYTTFSSFSLQTLTLAQNGEWLHAAANVIGSITLCLLAVWLGYYCVAVFNRS